MKQLFVITLLALILAMTANAYGGEVRELQPYFNGLEPISNPSHWQAYKMELVQLKNGYAIFSDVSGFNPGAVVAVRTSSLAIVEKGLLLNQLPAMSKGHVRCLKYLGQEQSENQDGFPLKVAKYEAVACEGGN